MKYNPAIKKNKILPFVTVWMALKNLMLSEISQSEKDKHHRIYSHVESNEQAELTMKMGTDSQMESRVTAGGRVERLSKKEKRLTDMDNSVVIMRGERV